MSVNKENKLIVTVGLPRSGKTTWAMKQGVPVVCPDAIRLAMHGEAFIAKAEPWVWTSAYMMAEALFLAGHDTVIVDATNTTEKRRKEWTDRFKNVEFRVFATSMNECIKRALLTGRHELEPIIRGMASRWDVPAVNINGRKVGENQ